ncbi:MAG: tRNA threonylcarbamoyladenosine dehydratase [Bacteroidales bacterium]|nr:tRNA threonylcarbamoyladenosine dehydratase [Bacteroidales bacterium]
MEHWLDRTRLLMGENNLEVLRKSTVLVAGLGGVGSYAAEMLARAGVGNLILIDHDVVTVTNINRQLPALTHTVGLLKIRVMEERIRQINPDIVLNTCSAYLEEESIPELLKNYKPDYVVDAIDTLSPKTALIRFFLKKNIPLVSSMGAGARFDATALRIEDISRTKICPLASTLRKRLRKQGVHTGFKAVFSIERPISGAVIPCEGKHQKSMTGTISYLPAVFGCVCAQTTICDLLEIRNFENSFKQAP